MASYLGQTGRRTRVGGQPNNSKNGDIDHIRFNVKAQEHMDGLPIIPKLGGSKSSFPISAKRMKIGKNLMNLSKHDKELFKIVYKVVFFYI